MYTFVSVYERLSVFGIIESICFGDEVELHCSFLLNGGTDPTVLLKTVEQTELIRQQVTVRDVVDQLLTLIQTYQQTRCLLCVLL